MILTYPRILSIKKNFLDKSSRDIFKLSLITILGVIIFVSIYIGIKMTLTKLSNDSTFAYLSPHLFWSLILSFLFVFISLSNLVTTFSIFFESLDIDLIALTPYPKWKAFFAKTLESTIDASWMTLLFLLPTVGAFANFHNLGFEFYFYSFLAILPLVYSANLLTLALLLLTIRYVPPFVMRVVRTAIILLAFPIIVFVLSRIPQNPSMEFITSQFIKLLSLFSFVQSSYFPTSWTARVMSGMIEPHPASTFSLYLCYSFVINVICIVFLIYQGVYSDTLSLYRTYRTPKSNFSLNLFRNNSSIAIKDYLIFSRSPSQYIHLFLLGGIVIFYFYNMRILSSLKDSVPVEIRGWWDQFVILSARMIQAFIISALGVRLVFNSISHEGKCIELLKTSPISIKKLLQIKFLTWFLPVALVFGVLFFKTYADNSTLHPVLSLILNISQIGAILALAVGFGAIFAKFDWEHEGQLVASIGSLVYMCFSAIYISAILFTQYFGERNYLYQTYVLILGINLVTIYYSIKTGVKYLEKKIGAL